MRAIGMQHTHSFGADVDVGYGFEKEQEVWNGKLGLPLEALVKEAVELS
jgi:hypothetical protein